MRTALLLVVASMLGSCAAPLGLDPERNESDQGLAWAAPDERSGGSALAAPKAVATGDARPTNPDRAYRWRRLRWLDEHGQIAPDALARAIAQRQTNIAWCNARPHAPDVAGINPARWFFRGPGNVGGRTRSIVIDPTNPAHLLGGSVGGGVWSSLNDGANWLPVTDQLPSLAIGCLAADPNNPGVVYAGTGEGFFNGDALGGVGIYKSVNGGSTWSLMPSTAPWAGGNVCRIAVAPGNSSLILVGRRYHGIWRSTDGGATWTNPRWAQGGFQVAFEPTDASKAVAEVIDYDSVAGDWFHQALYSTDAGATWTPAAGPLGHMSGFGARIELAYAPSNPSIVYASCADGGGLIWRSTDGGQSYSLRTVSGSSGSNWYASPLWVDPTNPDFLLTGGYHIVRSTDGGATLTQISNGYILTGAPHPDIHFFANDPGFNGTTNRRVYVCTDGGIHRTDNIYAASQSSGWVSLQNGYQAAQFYGAAGEGASGRIVGGTQDNGTLRVTMGGNTTAGLMFGGDGGFCAVDPTNPQYCYGEYITLQIHRSSNGGQSAGYITAGLADAGVSANFIAPFILDPNTPSTMLAGGASLWRSTNVKAPTPAWSAIRAPGSDLISAIAVAPGHSDVVWVAQNNGVIQRTSNGTSPSPTWITVDDNGAVNPLPNRYVARLMIDPDNPQVVYVALAGFADNNLWRTTNGGATWTDHSGTGPSGLPSAPIYGVARHPTRSSWLYVGTEVGVFASNDGGSHWSATSDGPGVVSVDELVFMSGSTTLLAATHGRGMYTAAVLECRADLTGDEQLNIGDFIAFQTLFAIGDPRADFDSNGVFNVNDFVAFQTAFALGCP